MNRIAYIIYDADPATHEWIASYGCDQIIEDKPENYYLRTGFRQTISQLKSGDELIISRFSNVVQDTHQFAVLLDYCRIGGIRLISVEDRIDTHERLFGVTSALRMIQIITALPKEVHERRLAIGDQKVIHFERKAGVKKEERRRRERTVIEMYLAGHSIETIQKKCDIKHSALYLALKRNGIKPDRYPQRGLPKGQRNQTRKRRKSATS